MNPRTGRERALPVAPRGARVRRLVVVGAGPAGLAAAAEASAMGHEVVVLERGSRIGGQLALAGAAPAHAETARSLADNYVRLLSGADVRCGAPADEDAIVRLEPDGVVVATGAAPFRPVLPLEGRVVQAWEVLAGARPDGDEVVVADWGGDPSGFAAAELLADDGARVTVVLASVSAGESLHQYTRNLYLERLYRAGVRIEHHLELVASRGARARFRNLFAPELEIELPADALVLSLGRVPVEGLAPRLAARGVAVEEAGDCRSPRSLEEATLEGTLAARRLLDA